MLVMWVWLNDLELCNLLFIEGFHIKTPIIDTVEKFDIRLSKFESQAGASSKDLQVVQTSIAVQYSMTPELMPRTLQKVGQSCS